MKRNDPHPGFPRRLLHRRKLRGAVPLLACLVLLAACGGGGGGSFAVPNPGEPSAPSPGEPSAPSPGEPSAPSPGEPSTPCPVGLEFRPTNLGAPAASDGKDYRTAEYGEHWGLESISAHTAYQRGYFGQDVTIAIADDGMDLTHPDLAGRITVPKRVIHDDEFVTENSQATVHGT